MTPQTASAARKAALRYDVPFPTVLAVTQQESGGTIFATIKHNNVTRPEPLIRWEGHYFDRRLTGRLKERARSLGLAAPRAGAVKNPTKQQDRWDKLLKPAAALAREPAYQSISGGVGQVMGSHGEKLGFASAEAMFEYQRKGVDEQVDVMMKYCQVFGLIDELQRGDFRGFERGYNGPAAGGVYARGIAALAKKYQREYPDHKGDTVEGVPVNRATRSENASRMLRLGTKGARVRELQALLLRAGYAVKVDGDYGPATKDAVIEYQKANELEPDGIAGPATFAKLDELKVDPEERPGTLSLVQSVTETEEGRTGGATAATGVTIASAKEGIEQATWAITPQGDGGWLDIMYLVLTLLGVGLTVAGLAYVIWGWYKANRKTEGVKV